MSDEPKPLDEFNQRATPLSREQAEVVLQMLHGIVIGVERVTDEEMEKWLRPQYCLAKPQ